MTDHDSWVGLHPNSPYEALISLFPNGFPVRDPFPMYTGVKQQGKNVALWSIDLDRLEIEQCEAIASAIAAQHGADPEEILNEAIDCGFFGLDEKWVRTMEMGAEGYARTLELRAFMLAHPEMNKETADAMRLFMEDQIERWVEGDEITAATTNGD